MMHAVTRRERGFTIMEIIVVLGVLGMLMGAAVPLVSTFLDRQRTDEVHTELEALSGALTAYYQDHGRFPRKLDDDRFLGHYLQEGMYRTAILDGWSAGGLYAYGGTSSPDVVTLTSVGPNGRYEKGQGDDLQVRVAGAPIGIARTHARIRVISSALGVYIAGGGTLTGTWKRDLKRLGLAAPYDADGFGTPFRLNPKTQAIESAGADRRFGTDDDLTS